MRKLLLASAATLALGGAGAASAQTNLPATVLQGQVATTPTASVPGANNNNNYQAPALPGPIANPTPGSIVIHLNARVMTEFAESFGTLNHVGANKVSPNQFASYVRIYPGMDGMAANGLRYGGSIELRENFTAAPTPNTGSGPSSSASGYTSTETMFVRRAFTYLANDQLGILRIGQADGLIGIFDNGVTTFQNISPTGALNGGDLQSVVTGNSNPPFVFLSQAGNEYGNNKFVYLSPQIAGFDIGLQYAPTIANAFFQCGAAGTDCPNLSSTATPPFGARVKDQYAAGVRYQGKFSDIGLLAYAVYEGSGHVNYTGTPAAAIASLGTGAAAGTTYTGKFNNIGITNVGVAVTFAGLTVGGNGIFGAMNGQLAPKPAGGANVSGWLAGARYVFGPASIGAAFESYTMQGAVGLTGISQRRAYAGTAAVTYSAAPGLTFFADYLYQNQKQGDWNFATSAVGAAYNNVTNQAFMVGTLVTW